MSQSTPPSYSRSKQYAAIEAAMMQSEKGRGFLRDYLRRNRSAETQAMLDAIVKLQRSLHEDEGEQRLKSVRRDLTGLQRNMAQSRRALSAIAPAYASGSKDGIPRTSAGVLDAREAGEVITEAAATIGAASEMLRESGAQDRLCGQIERQVELVHEACAVVKMNRERAKILDLAFAQVEAEIMAILDIWDFHTVEPAEDVVAAPTIKRALMNGLAEELSIAMLTDAQKAALFH